MWRCETEQVWTMPAVPIRRVSPRVVFREGPMLVHKMRADLIHKGSTVMFVWGQGSYISDGYVGVKLVGFSDGFETYTIPEARKYWSRLLNKGYYRLEP